MSKYETLKTYLSRRTDAVVRLRFDEIEAILGFALPKSALRYDEWWANNTDGHSHARAWVDAGWRKDVIDRKSGTVVFRRTQPAGVRRLVRSELFGRLKGSVVVKSGVDLTDPTDEVWTAERGILHE